MTSFRYLINAAIEIENQRNMRPVRNSLDPVPQRSVQIRWVKGGLIRADVYTHVVKGLLDKKWRKAHKKLSMMR